MSGHNHIKTTQLCTWNDPNTAEEVSVFRVNQVDFSNFKSTVCYSFLNQKVKIIGFPREIASKLVATLLKILKNEFVYPVKYTNCNDEELN